MKLFEQPAHVLHDMLVNKEITSLELTEAVLARIDEVEGDVQAYLTVTRDEALAQAKAVDEKIARGEEIAFLEGIPGAIKDNICTKGVKTTCASRILQKFVPPYDATVVQKLAAQNPVVLGKTNLDEFAMGGSTENSAFHPTHNPWNTDCVPGGSSGGSAAAVAAGTAVWALGSDTGGSIRQPASFCGVVGMKPTYGRVSRYGLVAYASSLDQIGPITKDVTDCANILNIIAGRDEMDSTSIDSVVPDYTKSLVQDVKGLKIGLPKEYFVKGMDPEVEGAVKAAVKQLESLGAEVVEISLPNTDYAISTYYLIAPAEAATNLARYDGVSYGERAEDAADLVEMMTKTRSQYLGEEVKRRIMIGNFVLSSGFFDAYYLKAQKARTLLINAYNEVFEKYDALLCPVAPAPAFKIGEKVNDPLAMYMEDVMSVPPSMAGLPAISVPTGKTKAGLPVGAQLIGQRQSDQMLLSIAKSVEEQA